MGLAVCSEIFVRAINDLVCPKQARAWSNFPVLSKAITSAPNDLAI